MNKRYRSTCNNNNNNTATKSNTGKHILFVSNDVRSTGATTITTKIKPIMDIESDDSERWEDFFGSSTELAPSLLGIYDTLTSSFDTSNGNVSDCSDHVHHETHIHHSINHNNNNIISKESAFGGEQDKNSDSVATGKSQRPRQLSVIDSCTFSCVESSSAICQSLSSSSRSLSGSRSSSNSSGISSTASNQSVGSGSTCNKHRNNIRILSPNVQRIITHSDAEPVDAIDIDAIQNQQNLQLQIGVASPVLSQRHFRKSPTPTSSTPGSGHKVKLSHIPLSKVTGKLTQSGSDLMETFDSSSEYLDALNYVAQEKKIGTRNSNFIKKPPTPAIIDIKITDDDQTPTNSIPSSPFNFDAAVGKLRKLTLPKSEAPSLEHTELMAEPLYATSANGKFVASTPKSTNGSAESIEESDDFEVNKPPLKPSEVIDTINYTFTEKLTITSKDTSSSVSLTSAELIEAINKPLISKPLVRSSSAACASTTTASPLLTYARSKSLTAKANTLGGPVPIKLPTAQQLEELEEAQKMSAESLDRLTDIKSKFSPKESRKNSGLMLPEIARLKHRPLSSSSICSTSSSSSSGSDQLNGKQATSYLASVESLADQSENELMDPHSGMSVFERACMEIVDSERSYVEDLGQVIRGYLFDWKERACLSYDKLRTLFSNIEDIYEFNSTLLKQLINSGMDPVKIAKCFIDLQERFDVYTTYCTSYPEAISLLTKLLQATHTNALLTSTQKMLQHTLPLGSYLLKPVQRILKYHLLLDNLRKHCDVKEVVQAYEIMRQVARNIDQVKRKLEQQSRVKELSGILDGWLGPELTVLGELRQEGLLMEHNKPRMVFLFDTMLIITKSKEDNRLQFKSYIHQNNLMLSEHLPGDPTSFYVIPYDDPRNQIKLTAKNRDQKRLWAQHIKGVILAKFKNIPSRAMELVYKLGDEEDRTPDKHIWKWSLHNSSSSTPVYLERRNQCRRSEMRNRTKLKRKTVANSTSFESFIEMGEQAKENTPKPAKPLSRNNSLDESMLPALQKFAAAVRNKGKHDVAAERKEKAKSEVTKKDNKLSESSHSNANESPSCELREKRVTLSSQPKSPLFGGHALKERSKSVPRISYQLEDLEEDQSSLHGSNSNLDARKSKTTKSVEIRQYNHKTLPKRIVTLKKQRMSKRETSIFYRDLSEMDEPQPTELKITESTEDLLAKTEIEQAEECKEDMCLGQDNESVREGEQDPLPSAGGGKKDAQIILDLIKDSKGFNKIYNKPQKKRSVDSTASTPTSPEPQEAKQAPSAPLESPPPPPPPRPPSRSPPPLEFELKKESRDENDEPIYESLLRNVHVPYKYSPVLVRNKLPVQMYCAREKKAAPPLPRPESDYVTLIYSAEGALQKVGEENVQRSCAREYDVDVQRDSTGSSSSSSSETLKRDSQNTVINVECLNSSGNISELSASTNEAIYARPMPKNLMKRLLSGSSSGSHKFSVENACNSESSLLPRARKSIDNISLGFGVRSNKPPERRVSDVTEMCRQSILHRQGSEAVGERMAHVDYADPKMLFSMNSSEVSLQRDSVFSLTSSNDSVYEQQKRSAVTSSNFEYEDDVEACLENDFRDSAIYSDDNEKRGDCEAINCIKRPSSPPPLPPSTRIPSVHHTPPQIPPKPTRIPPVTNLKSPTRSVAAKVGPEAGVIVCPPNMSASASRSWVLQQIENFNK